jgi:uncharacterized protein YgiB involved in biofilm formation
MAHSLEDRGESNSGDANSHADVAGGVSRQPAKPARLRKRSLHLTLVFISAAAIAGCGRLENDANTSRDVYANLEECRADWGNPEDCEEIDEKRSATGSRAFYGPRYSSRTGSYGGYTTTTRPGSRSKGTVTSGSSASRGGFGSSSSRHSSSSYSG